MVARLVCFTGPVTFLFRGEEKEKKIRIELFARSWVGWKSECVCMLCHSAFLLWQFGWKLEKLLSPAMVMLEDGGGDGGDNHL